MRLRCSHAELDIPHVLDLAVRGEHLRQRRVLGLFDVDNRQALFARPLRMRKCAQRKRCGRHVSGTSRSERSARSCQIEVTSNTLSPSRSTTNA